MFLYPIQYIYIYIEDDSVRIELMSRKDNYNNSTNPILTNEGMYLIVMHIKKFLIHIGSLSL